MKWTADLQMCILITLSAVTWAIVDTDQILQNVAKFDHQGLHYLLLTQWFLTTQQVHVVK